MLESLTEKHFILVEYGLQSIYEKTLSFINRGHDYKTFLDAVSLTRSKGIFVGAHLIVGFPTETREEMLNMADEVSGIHPNFLKIHQLQVIKDTPLAEMYKENPFHTFGYEEYLDFIVDFIERLSPDIVLQRLFATALTTYLLRRDGTGTGIRLQEIYSEDLFKGIHFRGRNIRGKGYCPFVSSLNNF